MLLWPAFIRTHTTLAFNNSMRKQFIITYFCSWYLGSNRLLLVVCCFTTFIPFVLFFVKNFHFSQLCAWLSLLNWDDLAHSMLIMHHDKYFFMCVLFWPICAHLCAIDFRPLRWMTFATPKALTSWNKALETQQEKLLPFFSHSSLGFFGVMMKMICCNTSLH